MHRKNQVLLFEKDLRKVLIKKGLEPELADICHEISDKYSIFVANFLFFSRNFYITDKESYVENELYKQYIPAAIAFIEELFKEQEKPTLPKKPNDISYMEARELSNQLRYIKDWDSDVERTDKTDIKSLTWEQALEKAREYHREKAENALSRGLETKSDQTYVMKFPDGSYWLNLKSQYCREEGDAMGHCGNASDGGILYSLRDKQGVPSITAEIDRRSKTANQIYGRGNSTPAEKYHKRILELIGKLNLQTVKVKDYGGKSLNVEEDISDELKRWFEEEYDYYPTIGGVTDKVWTEATRTLQNAVSEMDHISCSIDEFDASDYDDSVPVSSQIRIKLPLFDNFWKSAPGIKLEKQLQQNISYMSSEKDDHALRFYTETKYLNISDAVSLSESVDDLISELDNLDNDISKTIEQFLVDVVEKNYDELIYDYEDGDKVPKEWEELSSKFDFLKRIENIFNYASNYHSSWKFANPIRVEISHFVTENDSARLIPLLKQKIEKIIERSADNSFPQILQKLDLDVVFSELNNIQKYSVDLRIKFPVSESFSYKMINDIFTEEVVLQIKQEMDSFVQNPRLESDSFKKFFYSFY